MGLDKKKIYAENHVEILAPAGSYEAMTAAALGGCDAVYAAGMKYGARAYAKNFSVEELCRAIDYLHLRGKKLYVTMNTLIKEDEMDSLLFNTLEILYKEGLDAVIVQDTGLMKFIHENFPKLPIHASTQTSLMSACGANFLKQSGVRRLIPARECSLSDIRLLRENTDMEIECFVHGALCFCYSGHCLFSSMNGGRSGNRGQCAQPCRKPYSLNRGFSHLLSPKDMCTLYILPDLIEAGIDSFKIEGRMKNPEYCVLTAFLYKKYSEEYYEHGREYYENNFLSDKGERHKEFLSDIRDAMDIFNRGGFTTGYYKNQNGKDMMSEKRPNHFGSLVGTVTGCGFEKDKKDTKNTKNCFKITIMPDFDIQKDDVLEIRDSQNNTVLLLNGSMNFKKGCSAEFSPYGLFREDRDKIKKLLDSEGSLELYRLRNHSLLNRLNENFLKESIRNKKTDFKKDYPFLWGIPVKAYLSGRAGEVLNLRLECSGTVSVSTEQILLPADKEGFSDKRLREQINKTGEYPFSIELNTDGLDRNCFIPMSLFNRLRRDAMERLKEKIEVSKKRKYNGKDKKDSKDLTKPDGIPADSTDISKNKPVISCSVISAEQAEKVAGLAKKYADAEFEIILNGSVCPAGQISDMLRKLEKIKKTGAENFPKIYLSMPAVFPPRVQKIWERGFTEGGTAPTLKKEFDILSGIYVRTFDEAGYMKAHFPDMEIRAEFSLYVWNKKAAEFYRENGISYNTLSPEFPTESLSELDLSCSYLPVYGSVCLMVSAQCLIKNSSGCTSDNFYRFKNKEGKSFLGMNVCSYCYNLIFSEDSRYLNNYAEVIGNREIYGLRFDFYMESPDIIEKIISSFT